MSGRNDFTALVQGSSVIVVDALVSAVPDVGAPGDCEEADEERDGGNGEHGDGSAETGAYLWSSAGGGVATHTAALRVGGGRARQQKQRREAKQRSVSAEEMRH
jgi:hypothetical protein